MFFVSLQRPTLEQEQAVCAKGARLGFNFKSAGSSRQAPPLPQAVQEDGWWNIDHERIKVGYGKPAYESTKSLLSSWGQFQLPWAQVQPSTALKPGTPVCVTANVFGLWTAVPLEVVYKEEARWHEPDSSSSGSGAAGAATKGSSNGSSKSNHSSNSKTSSSSSSHQGPFGVLRSVLHLPGSRSSQRGRHGQHLTYAHACLQTHFLAGEERFRVEWDQTDDSVWYDIYTFSRPAHPLAWLGYPVVRHLQAAFRRDSLRMMARAAAVATVDSCLDDATRRRIEQAEAMMLAGGRQQGGSGSNAAAAVGGGSRG